MQVDNMSFLCQFILLLFINKHVRVNTQCLRPLATQFMNMYEIN